MGTKVSKKSWAPNNKKHKHSLKRIGEKGSDPLKEHHQTICYAAAPPQKKQRNIEEPSPTSKNNLGDKQSYTFVIN